MWKCERCGRSIDYAFVVDVEGKTQRYCAPRCVFLAGLEFGIAETRRELAELLNAQAHKE